VGDPFLLLAHRTHQDMRDAADRERLIRSASTGGPSRLRAAFRRAVGLIPTIAIERRRTDDDPAVLDHEVQAADGRTVVVEAPDRATARLVAGDANRLVQVAPLRR